MDSHKLTRVLVVTVISSLFLSAISGQRQDIICKSRPGCHLAKCDPSPSFLSANRNEYPLSCIRSSNNDDEVTKAQYEKELAGIKGQLSSFRSDLRNLRTRNAILEDKVRKILAGPECEISGGVFYRLKCYIIPGLSYEPGVSYTAALHACRQNRAEMAEIHDRQQQKALMRLVNKYLPLFRLEQASVWVGMEYNREKETFLYRSGKRGNRDDLIWNGGQQTKPLSSRNLYIVVKKYQGLDNFEGGMGTVLKTTTNGVLCERDA